MQIHLDGQATDEQIDYLKQRDSAWAASLYRLLDEAEARLASARRDLRGAERAVVLADLDADCWRIDEVLTEVVGAAAEAELQPVQEGRGGGPAPAFVGDVQLHLSRSDGRIVAWASGAGQRPETDDQVLQRIRDLGGVVDDWDERATVKIPGNGRVATVSAPIEKVLGWLAPLGGTADDDRVGASVTWMGLATAVAIELVMQGRYAPQLIQQKRRRKDPAAPDQGTFRMRWLPALVDDDVLDGLASSVPGAAMLGSREQDKAKFAMAALTDLVDAIVGFAAGQIESPAAPPEIRTKQDVAETALCLLAGEAFVAPAKAGGELVRRMTQWAQPVVGATGQRLVVQLDPPDEMGAWHVSVLAPAEDGGLEPVEVAVTTGSKTRAKQMAAQLARLERLFPELLRLGGRRRGEVMLSQDEAWNLMTDSGDVLTAAGFDVRVPDLRRQKAVASLRLTSEADDSAVGAQQLADVRWSAVFDEVELTAAEIAKLAAEARPLVKSRGQWVELDKADLAEAAAALAERADQTRLTGAEMLRHALGLEGSPLAGGVSIMGAGWAADLLRSVESLPEAPTTTPEGFSGELRSYQADALAWLDFLDSAGLGGCLALDMGLGKTPTALASLYAGRDQGTSLVIAPPAVVGNWASEAKNFVPDLKVVVHHGASRAKGPALGRAVRGADLVITTYGTAVRDMDQLSEYAWGKVVIDEAQAIKNPAAETSKELRRLDAKTRVALTGTPIENGLGDLWAILDWANPGLLGPRAAFISQLTPEKQNSLASNDGEQALRALNGILVYRRTKAEPAIAAELPDRIDELDHCAMTPEQIGLYQAVVDSLIAESEQKEPGTPERKGAVLAAITALKQICNHPVNYRADDNGIEGRSGKLVRLNEIIDNVFAADEKVLVFTHFATWGETLAGYLTERTGKKIDCYHGGLGRGARDRMVDEFQKSPGAGAMVLSLKAGGTGLNLTAANHVVLYDRWWNPAVEDQARDRVWRIGQESTVICHRLVCPGTIDERVEEVVAGKRQIADITLPKSSSIGDLDAAQLQQALGIDAGALLDVEGESLDADVEEVDA
ncbi:MAG: DEAD/DEAH box helicase [Acidimicrobiales bacterium]|nr:DEAD/DEAH box helicase [Acidimicrobiales bacterium]